MRVKVLILIVGISLLWSSLAPRHHIHFSKQHHLKVADQIIQKAIASDEDLIPKKLSTNAISASANLVCRKISGWNEEFRPAETFVPKWVRYYLLFRVLRH